MANRPRIAMFSHFEGVPRDDGARAGDIVILWTEQGWFWVIPFQDGTTSVGVVGDPETIQAAGADDQERFDNLCAQSDVHRRYLAERRQLEPLRRHADYSFACHAKSGDRFLLLGDASGFVDPIFSTGVFLAQMGAFAASDVIAPALLAGELPGMSVRREFENKLGLGMRRYLALVQRFYDGRFMDDMVRARRRVQTQKALTSVLAGDIFDEDNPLIRMGVFGG
jgi:flavin-dependent dehydrogenase